MGLTSEQVHWIFGAVMVAGAALLVLRATGRLQGRWIDFVVPALPFLFGIEMLVDPLVHGTAVPGNYAKEAAQHFALGGLLIVAAAAEAVRIIRAYDSFMWRVPLAFALLVSAGVFLFHAQHDADVPMLLLMTQHRVIGATLAVSALAVLVASPNESMGARRPLAFPLLILVLGFEFLLYTEGNSLFGSARPEGSSHMSHGS